MLSATGTFVMKAIAYLLGTVVVLAGILYGGTVAGVLQTWLVVIGFVIGGLGIMGAASSLGSTTKAVETSSGPDRPMSKETKVTTD